MPANPGRLVVSEKLKPSGTTSTFTVSDNSFPLILVFGIINQLVHTHKRTSLCVHTCTEIQYIYWSTVVDTILIVYKETNMQTLVE